MTKYTRFCLKFNNEKDSLIIKALQNIDNKTGYIRDLIILDLARQERQQLRLSNDEYKSILKYIKEMEIEDQTESDDNA